MDYIFDSRRGRSIYPGRPFNGLHATPANWIHQGSVLSIISNTTTSVVVSDASWVAGGSASAGVVPASHFIRLLQAGTNRVRKITTVQADTPIVGQTTYNWTGGTDSAANTVTGIGAIPAGAVTAIYIGGAMLDIAATFTTADQGSPTEADTVYLAGFFDIGSVQPSAALIIPKWVGFPWAYIKSSFSGSLMPNAGTNSGDKSKITLDAPLAFISQGTGNGSETSSWTNCIFNILNVRLMSGSVSTVIGCLFIAGTVASVHVSNSIVRNNTFLQWDNAVIGILTMNGTNCTFANNFVKRIAGNTDAIFAVNTSAINTAAVVQSNIFQSANETDSIIAFTGKTYLQSELKQEPSNVLTTDTTAGIQAIRRIEAYQPAHARSINSNVHLSTGINRVGSVYAGYAYLGSPVSHIGFERTGNSMPIPASNPASVDDVNRIHVSVGTLSFGNTDAVTGRLILRGVPPWTFNWPSQEARAAGPTFTGTGPDGETINQRKIGANYYHEFANPFELKRVLALTSFRNGNDGTNDTLEAVDTLDTENPSQYTIKVEVMDSAQAVLFALADIAYNDPLALNLADARFIRYQVSARETVPRLA